MKVLRLLNRHTVYPAGGSSLKNRDRAELYGYTVIDPLSVLLMHLSEVIRQHSYELAYKTGSGKAYGKSEKTAPELVEEAIPQMISYSYFQRVLTNLLKEGIPIHDLETIVENLMQTASETGLPPRELDQTVEKIRTALKRTITRMYCTDGCMKAITLMPSWNGNGRILVKRGKWLISGIKPGNAPSMSSGSWQSR